MIIGLIAVVYCQSSRSTVKIKAATAMSKAALTVVKKQLSL